MVMTETTGATRSTTPLMLRLLWGALGAFLLLWDVFEVLKHMGWVIPGAFLGAAVPFLARFAGLGQAHERGQLAPRAVPLHNLLNRAWIPFGIMFVFSFLGDGPDDIAAPFTFGMSWLTSIALARAVGFGLRTREGWQR
ncbi:hypothetical protein [Streptomyces graminilatus]|uniref:hypothetical protein n=1 Tax=Streptomyces graminilatus TaxID=1464070 RepID=UPI0006E2EA34|nr:hypothetical protein [Streptomyces graminilatus]